MAPPTLYPPAAALVDAPTGKASAMSREIGTAYKEKISLSELRRRVELGEGHAHTLPHGKSIPGDDTPV